MLRLSKSALKENTLMSAQPMASSCADGKFARRSQMARGCWYFTGVADNRYGMTEHARILLQRGYGVVMMDSRAHGASGGAMATYGWLERKDTSAVIDALQSTEHPEHIFALGNSMGAGIALQAAGSDARIEAVAAEAPHPDAPGSAGPSPPR